ncbi:MAG TPA: hypothetical protein VE476_00150 [Propionibacteriaceae bacterium]|jgi:hypothetical protein|nr:hypothetical protein [Propionibacteriaceae bacterium]
MTIELGLSILLSVFALTVAELAGRKLRVAWLVGISAQAGWVAYALLTGNFGFLISVAGFTVIYVRNYRAWNRRPEPAAA